MPPAISIPTANHITASRMSTRCASAASSPCDNSHGGVRIQRDHAADEHARADSETDDDARADVQERDAESEADARRELVDRHGNRVDDPLKLRGEEDEPRDDQRTHHGERRLARLRAVRVEHDERFAGGDAVGERKVLVFDEVLAEWNGEEHAEQPRRRQPDERLHARQSHVEPARWVGAHACRTRRAASTETRSGPPSCPAVWTTLFSQRL